MKTIYLCLALMAPLGVSSQTFTKVINSPLVNLPGDSRSVNWVDVNQDGYVDCFISNGPSSGQDNAMFINNGDGGFDLLEDDPIGQDDQPSDGATFADIDNDGDLDAFVVNWYNRHNMAYVNDGTGHFEQVTDGSWVSHAGYSETASFGDYNNDGLVDLYVTNSEGISRNFLYRNDGELAFEKISDGGMVNDLNASRNVNWIDVDGDGDLDLFVTNEKAQKEQLYRNDGGAVFERVTDTELTSSSFSTMSSSWGDYDNDGDLDVFLATNGPRNLLYRNDGEFTFTKINDTEVTSENLRSFSSSWADIDNDGDLDLFVTNAFASGTRLKNCLYLNDGSGGFTKVETGAIANDDGWSYGCAFGDYDNDGFQDLAVATTRFDGTDEKDYLYHNDGNDNNWIMFSLQGTQSNRAGIGAIVRIKSILNGEPVWQMREISAQSAYCSQNDMRPHFGLADAVMVDSVIIEWPSGIVQYMTEIDANQIVPIEEEFTNSVGGPSGQIQLQVYPNPTDSDLQISGYTSNPNEKLLIELVSIEGGVRYASEQLVSSGKWNHEINLPDLGVTSGTYILRVRYAEYEEVKKILFLR